MKISVRSALRNSMCIAAIIAGFPATAISQTAPNIVIAQLPLSDTDCDFNNNLNGQPLPTTVPPCIVNGTRDVTLINVDRNAFNATLDLVTASYAVNFDGLLKLDGLPVATGPGAIFPFGGTGPKDASVFFDASGQSIDLATSYTGKYNFLINNALATPNQDIERAWFNNFSDFSNTVRSITINQTGNITTPDGGDYDFTLKSDDPMAIIGGDSVMVSGSFNGTTGTGGIQFGKLTGAATLLNGPVVTPYPDFYGATNTGLLSPFALGYAIAAEITTQLDENGLITPTVSVTSGINMNGSTITNLADGVSAGDAINKGQLDAMLGGVKYLAINSGGFSTGLPASAFGWDSVAIGRDSLSYTNDSTAIGTSAIVDGNSTQDAGGTAIGSNSHSTGIYATSLGASSRANGTLGTALGSLSSASELSTAVGAASRADGIGSVAIGKSSSASGYTSTAIGQASNAQASNSVALGQSSIANRSNTVSIGSSGAERQLTNLANGTAGSDAVNLNQLNAVGVIANTALANAAAAQTTANTAVTKADAAQTTANTAITNAAAAQTTANTALTNAATAQTTANSAISKADAAQATANQALTNGAASQTAANTALANSATAQTTANTALANAATAQTTANTAVAKADAAQTTANMGVANAAAAQGTANTALTNAAVAQTAANAAQGTANTALVNAVTAQTVAVAADTKATNALALATQTAALINTGTSGNQVVIGNGSTAPSGKAVSIGYLNRATGDGAVAIGDPNVATGTGAVAIGADNTATGNGAVALGNVSVANGNAAVALGNAANANGNGNVAIGQSSQATGSNSVALGAGSVANAANTISVGAAGAERKIVNVAAATVSTDAVNKGQLDSEVNSRIQADLQMSQRLSIVEAAPLNLAASLSNEANARIAADLATTTRLDAFGSRLDQIDDRLNGLQNSIASGTAVATAMGGAAFLPDMKFNLTANVATYDGAHAGALQLGILVSPNVALNAGVASGFNKNGKTAARAGVTIGW
jgi:trimeric autotransporter adhesin